jgi:nucleoside-diphosphate-sugar epimerase
VFEDLVTGAGGFIGSHLTERLVELDMDARVLVRYNARQLYPTVCFENSLRRVDIFQDTPRY